MNLDDSSPFSHILNAERISRALLSMRRPGSKPKGQRIASDMATTIREKDPAQYPELLQGYVEDYLDSGRWGAELPLCFEVRPVDKPVIRELVAKLVSRFRNANLSV